VNPEPGSWRHVTRPQGLRELIGGDRKVRFGHELVLPTVIGGLPGVALYYAFVRRHGKR
jgi:hypothetical protein